MRQTAAHRLVRLVRLGIRQMRYFGRKKTLFQLLMAATVANLTLVATKTGQMRTKYSRFFVFSTCLDACEGRSGRLVERMGICCIFFNGA